jgi:diguanylate cyclase (GGDEF)-like protein
MKHQAIGVTTLGVLTVAALAAVDYAVGRELGLSLFYSVPVFLVARRAGLAPGVGLALIAALGWALADAANGASYPHGWIRYWNILTRLGYFVMAVAAARMRSGLELEAARARHDPLTGLLNRRGFLEMARLELERSQRYGRPLTLAYLDCDDFKIVNDTHGHDAGDRLLHSTGRVLREGLRALDVPARMGGDEFVVLLPETAAPEARETLERLVGKLRTQLTAEGWVLTFSIGAVTLATPTCSVEEMLQAADRAMYRAKGRGKACIEHEVIGPRDASGHDGVP